MLHAPACLGALQKRRLGRTSCALGQSLKRGHEAGLAAVVGANLVNGVRPFGATDEVLEKVSHYATEPAAKKLEKAEPGLAARLWRAQGMRIVNKSKSKYYDAALTNFERARRCYERAGRGAD